MPHPHKPILVGVDGSEEALRAVRYAAREAERRDTAVDLVHVSPRLVALPPVRPVAPPSWPETGRAVLREAAAVAREVAPDRSVHTRLLTGSRTHELLKAGAQASMIVLGTEHPSTHGRILTSATTTGVASHSRIPVVVVPPEWDQTRPRGRVVVGFKSVDHAPGLLAAAFSAAAAHDAELVILHTWWMTGVYDDIIEARVDPGDWRERSLIMIEPLIADLRVLHPGVRVRIEVTHAQPARALVDASMDADLLIVGHPDPSQLFGHLGATGRAVLRSAECPVEVLPDVDVAPPTTDLVLEDAGRLRR